MTWRVDFTIGPVQGFLARSRRTTDLWGSSFLLSQLVAHALVAARRAGGRVVLPAVEDDPLVKWVESGRQGDPPRVGSLPNHFAALADEDPAAVAEAAGAAVADAWMELCEEVWTRYVEPAAELGQGTREIWDRQVRHFWEIAWTAGPQEAGSLLWRRKFWRSHRRLGEPGDKCSLMRDLQELSGHIRSTGREERDAQDRFWSQVREHAGPLSVAENERLSAIGFVKRMAGKLSQWDGRESGWPSTVYVGAVCWVRKALEAAPQETKEYAEYLREQGFGRHRAWKAFRDLPTHPFAALDGNAYHLDALGRPEIVPREGHAAARALLMKLQDAKGEGGRPIGPAPRFYALLLADGDRLGHLASGPDGHTVPQALAQFTRQAPRLVCERDGVCVYAGGDDVLALLPMETALDCARELARTWPRCFPSSLAGRATMSAAVVFAHVRHPMGGVLQEARRLLDAVAKAANGRDSLAVGILRRSGLNCQWATTWDRKAAGGDAVDLLGRMQAALAGGEAGLSTSFLYRIRETLAALGEGRINVPGEPVTIPQDMDLTPLLYAELDRLLKLDREDKETSRRALEASVRDLAALLQPVTAQGPVAGQVLLDGPMLAHFLNTGGVTEEE